MASRILTWNTLEAFGNKYHIGPAYYIEAGYSPVAVRLHAEVAPDIEDAEFQIYDDGVPISGDRSTPAFSIRTGTYISDAVTTIALPINSTDDELAEDFKPNLDIEKGSWITCNCVKDGGGRNFTVHLELLRISEEDED